MPSPARRRRSLIALVATVALATAACTDAAGQSAPPDVDAPAAGESAGAAGQPAPPEEPPAPDLLPDPEVAPGSCETVTYTPPTAEDEHEGQLCRPEEDQRDVAVVLVHGGSGIGGSPGSLEGWRRRLNAEGYVTFQITYHLFSPGSGESPVFPRPEQNVKAAVQYLRGTGNALGIDKDRIAVQGHSAGARVGAVAYATGGDPWFAGDELWPELSDEVDAFVGFYHPYDGTMQYATQYFGGSDGSDDPVVQRRLAEADALARADRADAPALFVTGEDDWAVIEEQQDEFVEALQEDGQEARSVVIEDGAHGFDLGGSRLTRLGEESATHVLEFYNDVFPQDPPREAQGAEVDLDKAPRGTGTPPTTAPVRTRRSSSSGSGSSSGGGSSRTTWGDGGASTTWGDGTSDGSTTTEAGGGETTTTGATSPATDPPPSTTAPPPSTTAAPTTVAPTTTPPPPSSTPPGG